MARAKTTKKKVAGTRKKKQAEFEPCTLEERVSASDFIAGCQEKSQLRRSGKSSKVADSDIYLEGKKDGEMAGYARGYAAADKERGAVQFMLRTHLFKIIAAKLRYKFKGEIRI